LGYGGERQKSKAGDVFADNSAAVLHPAIIPAFWNMAKRFPIPT